MFFPVIFKNFFKNTFFHRTLPVIASVLLAFAVHKVLEFVALRVGDDFMAFKLKCSDSLNGLPIIFLTAFR